MTTESTTKKPETKADKSSIKESIKDPQPSKTMIDDEDEFEDFAVNDYKEGRGTLEAKGWEDTWEDDEKEDEFFVQLGKETVKKDGIAPMKM